jgi:hypothetical protein
MVRKGERQKRGQSREILVSTYVHPGANFRFKDPRSFARKTPCPRGFEAAVAPRSFPQVESLRQCVGADSTGNDRASLATSHAGSTSNYQADFYRARGPYSIRMDLRDRPQPHAMRPTCAAGHLIRHAGRHREGSRATVAHRRILPVAKGPSSS